MARWKLRKTSTYRSHPWGLQCVSWPPDRVQCFRTWDAAIGWLIVTRQL